MGVPATGLPLALNCVPRIGTADLGMVGWDWDWENLCFDSCVSGGRELRNRSLCGIAGEDRDEAIVDSSSSKNVDIEAPALAALAFWKKAVNL